jgi:hypothetical protein
MHLVSAQIDSSSPTKKGEAKRASSVRGQLWGFADCNRRGIRAAFKGGDAEGSGGAVYGTACLLGIDRRVGMGPWNRDKVATEMGVVPRCVFIFILVHATLFSAVLSGRKSGWCLGGHCYF